MNIQRRTTSAGPAPDHDEQPGAATEARHHHEPTPDLGGGHEHELDHSAVLFAQNAGREPPTRSDATSTQPRPHLNDGIIYLGMNSTVGDDTHEHQNELEAKNLPGAVVIAHSEDGPDGADHARVGGRSVDLSTPEGAKAFAQSLGLPPAQSGAIARVLRGAGTGSRDELAGLARLFARAEHGGTIPSRLVLSGHSVGEGIYDGAGKDGGLGFASVQALADAMPEAAAQIEDLMLSACSTGYEGVPNKTSLSSWKAHFPNLKTAWGYEMPSDFHSPTENHAVSHITAWREHTRGRTNHLDGPSAVRESYARHHDVWGSKPLVPENVAVWTESQGYREGHR